MTRSSRDSSVSGGLDPEATGDHELRDPEGFAKQIIVQRLAERARSRAELAEALAKRHVPEAVAQSLLDRFEAAGLVNDEDFARLWVEQRQRGKGLSKRVLELELRRKGIDEEISRHVLADIDPEAERRAAHQLVQKRLRSLRGLDQTTQIRRLTGMLARKGYAPQLAFDVVREELDAEPVPLESL